MSKQDILTILAREVIKDPNFSPKGEPMPIADNDFTEATNDVSEVARDTLAYYLGYNTSLKKSVYPVSPDEELLERPHVRGTSVKKPSESQEYFTKGNTQAAKTFRSEGYFFEPDQISDVISKNASNDKKLGHDLLNKVPEVKNTNSPNPAVLPPSGEDTGSVLLRHIHEQLTMGNMFSPDSTAPATVNGKPIADRRPFTTNVGGSNEEEVTRGLFSIQRDLGSFNVNGERVQVSDMSSLAMAMLLKSVGNDDDAANVLLNKSLSEIGLAPLKIVIRPAQFGATGLGIDNYRLSSLAKSSNIAAAATGQDSFIINIKADSSRIAKGVPPNNINLPKLQSTPRNAGSFAQLNSFMEPFAVGTRFSSTGMFTMAIASTLIMIGVGLAIDALSGMAKSSSQPNGDIKNPSSLVLGRHKPEGQTASNLTKFFNVTRTDYDFGDCVGTGIALLYGLSNNSLTTISQLSTPSTALVIAENLILAGGFYANFTRRMIASAVNVANTFSKIGGNVASGLESVLKGIEDLLDSVVYKFIMVSAGVGDAALKSKYGMTDVANTERLIPEEKLINPDDPDFTDSAKVSIFRNQTNRWQDGRHSLSLQTFLASQKEPQPNIAAQNPGYRYTSPSRENVQNIEDSLEAEYMPFYVHDLRTHEVMSFPAFITEFGETFNANYNAVEGIGRQDPVRMYSKTERTVQFGFMLVAFNEADHDHLWMAVNKLVAMCYPQYSAGRARSTSDGTPFIQPFSQVQAASPMVRLRLADVFKSNYSKFGLARLFGVGSSVMPEISKNVAKEHAISEKRLKVMNAEEKVMKEITKKFDDAKSKNDFTIGQSVILNYSGKAFVISAKSGKLDIGKFSISANDEATITNYFFLDSKRNYILKHKDGEIVLASNTFKDFSANEKKKIIDGNPDVISAKNSLESESTKLPEKSFFNSDNNAIVKSFDTTKGRGVAGFITTLALDYGMGNYPWSTKLGSKAPMIVKVNLGFAPITDLPLGLDYDGYMRNPSHPVGNLAGGFGDPYYDLSSDDDKNVKPMSRGLSENNYLKDVNSNIRKNWGTSTNDRNNAFKIEE